MTAKAKLDLAKVSNLELHLSLPCRGQEPKHLGRLQLLFPDHEQEAGWEMEHPEQEIVATQDAGITDRSLTCYATIPAEKTP